MIPEQSFTHIERDSKLWPNVFTHIDLSTTRRVDEPLFEGGLQGQGSVTVVVVVAEGSSVAEPALGRAAAEQKSGRDADDQEQFPA